MALAGGAAVPARAAQLASPAETVFLQQGLTGLVAELHDRSGPGDAQYWQDGVFVAADPACSPCHLGPATAAAVLRDVAPGTTPPWMTDVAIATFDRALENQLPDGTYVDPTNASAAIVTMFFANELGTALLHLRGVLPEGTRARWTDALRRASDRIVDAGETTFYANGNVQVGYAEMLYLTWLATGDLRYRTAFETAWNFAISPPQTTSRSGRGLIITKTPTAADGSDGAGYLTEQAGSNLGYDPSYTMLQADVLSRLYLLTRDPRVLRVLNLVTNQLLLRVDGSSMLDTDGGTRVSLGRVPFTTAAPAVLVTTDARPDLVPRARAQAPRLTSEYHVTVKAATPPQYRNVGTQLAMIVQTLSADPAAPPPAPVVDPAVLVTASP